MVHTLPLVMRRRLNAKFVKDRSLDSPAAPWLRFFNPYKAVQ